MDKTIVFEGAGASDSNMTALLSSLLSKNNLDPNLVASLMNNRNQDGLFGGNGGGGMLMFLFLFLLLGRNGLNGLNGTSDVNTAANNELLMNAINGNNTAIRDLAAATNTSIQAVQSALSSLGNSITQLSGQIGISSQQIINSIQSGNQAISSQLASCCCDVQKDIMTQGYENRLAELNQTNQLTATMNGNNLAVLNRIDAFEHTQLLDKIEALREKNQTLQLEISQRNQNEFIYAQTRPIYDRLSAIECKQLPTYPQSFIPGTPLNTYQAPLYPYAPYPYPPVPFGGGCDPCHGGKNW